MATSSELQADAISSGFSVARLARGGSAEHDRVRAEAMELARALAAQTIVLADDAVVEELDDRQRVIADTLWPAAPLEGYQLHASFGAYLVAKVAVGWAPSGHLGLRHEPLDRERLLEDLAEHGVDRPRALRIVGAFERAEPGFVPDPMGLDVSRLAGLAEGTLTSRERGRALSQIAYSARCLTRLASVVNVLSTLRALLPFLPPEHYGPRFLAASFALALDRPGRALELIDGHRDTLALETLAEIALAMLEVERGEVPSLPDRGMILAPELESDWSNEVEPQPSEERASGEGGNDTEDVIEIVEEKVESRAKAAPSSPPPAPGAGRALPRPARFPTLGSSVPPADRVDLEGWLERARGFAGPVARGSILGLSVPRTDETVSSMSLPPDERLLSEVLARESDVAAASFGAEPEAFRLSGCPLDAVLPPARGVLRAIAAAFTGRAPTDASTASAGDLLPLLLRARALARIVSGDLESALTAVRLLSPREAPESAFALERLRRFRKNVKPTPEECQTLTCQLIRDLARQLGRTLAQTVPSTGQVERAR